MQIFLLFGLDKEIVPSGLMVGSIAGCVLSIGYLVATTELGVDTGRTFRTNFGQVHGYFPANIVLQMVIVAGIVLFIAGYLVAKLLTLVILANGVSILAVAGWCCLEALALLVLRYFVEKTWRFHAATLAGPVPSLLLHAFFYIGMLAAPFPFLRYVFT